jgi:anti-sigma28 factor (negative regulator of flagellin synthesis)
MTNTIKDINGAVSGLSIGPADIGEGSRSGSVATPPAGSVQAASVTPVETDAASLSAAGEAVKAAIGEAGSRSSFRPELVARLRQEVLSGSYKIDMRSLAAIVANVLRRMNP